MSRLLPPELYAHKQFKHHLGYGLFAPDPGDDYDKVRVGDVGYISHTGGFIRLFNAFHDADSPENQRSDLPEHFVPIAQQFRRLVVDRTLTKGHLVSESVDVIRFHADAGMTGIVPGIQVEAGMTLRLQCASRTGAVLLLNHAPTRQWARSSDAMVDYILVNCMSWLKLVKSQRLPVELHDLVFVRECTLAGDWATTVWDESSFHSEINFNIGIDGGPSLGVSYWGEWEDRVTTPKRQGPRRAADTRQAYSNEHFDQCIFLKGIRVALREWYQKLATMLAANHTPDDAGFLDYPTPSVMRLLKKIGFKVESIDSSSSSFRPIRNALELIAIFIFEESDVDIAVVEESDIISLNLDETESLESICEALINHKDLEIFTVMSTDSNSKTVGRIRQRQVDSQIGTSDLVLLDEAFVIFPGTCSVDYDIFDSAGRSHHYMSEHEIKSSSAPFSPTHFFAPSRSTHVLSEDSSIETEVSNPNNACLQSSGLVSSKLKGRQDESERSEEEVRIKAVYRKEDSVADVQEDIQNISKCDPTTKTPRNEPLMEQSRTLLSSGIYSPQAHPELLRRKSMFVLFATVLSKHQAICHDTRAFILANDLTSVLFPDVKHAASGKRIYRNIIKSISSKVMMFIVFS
ncbi:hypothetical protein ACEPAI_8265 [Sanghuangporus weigelae]